VLRCASCRGDVIDGEGGNVGDKTPDAHNRFSQLAKLTDFVIANKEGESDDGVNTLSHEEIVEKCFSLRQVVGQAIQREVIACANECRLNSIDDFAIKPAVDKRGDNSNVSGTTRSKALGGTRGNKSELIRRSRDPQFRVI
jgi:hypothetical protein